MPALTTSADTATTTPRAYSFQEVQTRVYIYLILAILLSAADIYVFTQIAQLPSPQQVLLFASLLFVPYLVALIGFIVKATRFASAVARGMALMAILLCCLAIVVPLFLFFIPFVVIPIAANVQLFRWCSRLEDEDVEWSRWIVFPAVWLLTVVIAHSVL